MRTLGLALLVCSLSAIACGDDDDGASDGESGKGGSSAGKGGSSAGKGGSSAGSAGKGGGSAGSANPEACTPMMAMMQEALPATCTKAEIDAYTECVETSCEPTWKTCYGPDYRDGVFSGACKLQQECISKDCACDDVGCITACPGGTDCGTCIANNGCGNDCKIPTCALEGTLGDAGITFDRTCDDVLACCATLAAQQKDQCTSAVTSIKMVAGANADLACSPLLDLYGMGSSDPACM